MTSGTTLAKMRTAMKIEAIGSNPVQPYRLISRVEMMTPTEPSVSAMTCCVEQNISDNSSQASPCETHEEDAMHVVRMPCKRKANFLSMIRPGCRGALVADVPWP